MASTGFSYVPNNSQWPITWKKNYNSPNLSVRSAELHKYGGTGFHENTQRGLRRNPSHAERHRSGWRESVRNFIPLSLTPPDPTAPISMEMSGGGGAWARKARKARKRAAAWNRWRFRRVAFVNDSKSGADSVQICSTSNRLLSHARKIIMLPWH